MFRALVFSLVLLGVVMTTTATLVATSSTQETALNNLHTLEANDTKPSTNETVIIIVVDEGNGNFQDWKHRMSVAPGWEIAVGVIIAFIVVLTVSLCVYYVCCRPLWRSRNTFSRLPTSDPTGSSAKSSQTVNLSV